MLPHHCLEYNASVFNTSLAVFNRHHVSCWFALCPQMFAPSSFSSELYTCTKHTYLPGLSPYHYLHICHSCWSAVAAFSLSSSRKMASRRPNITLSPKLWKRFMQNEEITADCLPPVNTSLDMASTKPSSSKSANASFTASDQEQAVSLRE
jgi:hypothetical protein